MNCIENRDRVFISRRDYYFLLSFLGECRTVFSCNIDTDKNIDATLGSHCPVDEKPEEGSVVCLHI